MSTSNKVFLAAIAFAIVAIAYMPPSPETIKIGDWTFFDVEPPLYDYLSLPLVLLISSVGLVIAGIKLRRR